MYEGRKLVSIFPPALITENVSSDKTAGLTVTVVRRKDRNAALINQHCLVWRLVVLSCDEDISPSGS